MQLSCDRAEQRDVHRLAGSSRAPGLQFVGDLVQTLVSAAAGL